MKKSILTLILISSVLACKNEVKKTEVNLTEISISEKIQEPIKNFNSITIQLSPKSGSTVSGTTEFTENDGVVQMTAKIKGLSEGFHAIHIHDKGDCSSSDGKSSGGHWNPTAQPHGKWGAETGYHKGDIGNFIVVEGNL